MPTTKEFLILAALEYLDSTRPTQPQYTFLIETEARRRNTTPWEMAGDLVREAYKALNTTHLQMIDDLSALKNAQVDDILFNHHA